MGHQVHFLAGKGSYCPFAKIIEWHAVGDFRTLISGNYDFVHFHSDLIRDLDTPYLVTQHGNSQIGQQSDTQTVFVSEDHARRHGSNVFVYNGLDWSDVGNSLGKREGFHFLGKAAWRRKNVKGAIAIIDRAQNGKLHILGGTRLNFSMGFRFTTSANTRFHGMVDNEYKYNIMHQSKGLVFPVRWHEPFGLAITESLYCGCPVFGTPYGSLPEIVCSDVGYLSNRVSDLVDAVRNSGAWSSKICKDYAMEYFNSKKMTLHYLDLYQKVIRGEHLNQSPPVAKVDPNNTLPWID